MLCTATLTFYAVHAKRGREALAAISESGFKPDYLELRRAADLGPVEDDTREAVILVAAHLGRTRLLDNLKVALPVA